MLCLGVETSCDETGVALVSEHGLLGQRLASQEAVHAVFGGVVPEIASREHLRVLPLIYRELLRETGTRSADLGAVAVARGPGLLGSLLVGVSFAKALCLSLDAPLVGVNHLWAHLLAPGLEGEMTFPALGLLVSGGHTNTYFIESPLDFRPLGRTLDDAAGEVFDKVAKALNLPYPGGRLVDRLAGRAEPDRDMFPRAYIDNASLDFSFSGLKTAVIQHLSGRQGLRFEGLRLEGLDSVLDDPPVDLARVCASFNWSVVDTLRIKVERALRACAGARSLVVAGGVAANSMLRRAMAELAADHGLILSLPGPDLCTDNAAMIAHAGRLILGFGRRHGLDLEAVPRGRAVPEDWVRES
ncbi:MAG: tRNA (adenosine(37)-N6)-threonylcarbamoyltransferase complex transferase subunit TsaD [Desulfovibrionaceae bacterium]|nr:tRNA (adenosine(37)-N6)-threonylcarbamoyltransferase complex transferase subunit TsaD [Desulfovibrionaceae bacterium]